MYIYYILFYNTVHITTDNVPFIYERMERKQKQNHTHTYTHTHIHAKKNYSHLISNIKMYKT